MSSKHADIFTGILFLPSSIHITFELQNQRTWTNLSHWNQQTTEI